MVTGIEDVARHAGVSKATVSRALSGHGYVAEPTRLRVVAAASALGYVVSSSASSLVTGRTNNVGVLMPVINQWFFASILEGVETALLTAGYDVMLYNLTKSEEARSRVFEYFLVRKRVDAIIAVTLEITPTESRSLLGLGKPIVGIGGALAGIPTLSIDDVAAGQLATEHLIALGHTNIMHVGGDPNEVRSFRMHAKRLLGFVTAMSAAGLPLRQEHYEVAQFDIPGGYAAGRQILGDPRRRPSAIFAAADELAIGIILAARELGILVPEELSVIGVDDHPLAAMFGLTSIAQRPDEQGAAAVALVLAQLPRGAGAGGAGPGAPFDLLALPSPPTHTMIPANLVVRASTSAPRHRGLSATG